jgi:predicted acetylornithine/succinylornithine family transaminase
MDTKTRERQYIINTYNRRPDFTLHLRRGEGVYVWDEKGNRYLDFVTGLAVNSLGHCHPAVVAAICNQAQKLLHTSNLYYTEPQVKLAELLVGHTPADKIFFCNSGAEANEGALKLARKLGKKRRGGQAHAVITAENSFHGRTLATITATGQPKFRLGFEPPMPGFYYARFNDLESFAALINDETCAIMVEPVQGEGGVYPATTEFLAGLRKLCDDHGLVLIFDEVQCGMGRCGKLLACRQYGVEPDLFSLAKALGGGMPIGALGARGEAAEVLVPGDHASTFGGNPVTCAAAVAVLETMLGDGFLPRVEELGRYLMDKLKAMSAVVPRIREVRGLGLMIGVEIEGDAAAAAGYCQEKGLLVNAIGGKILRLLPPLVVEKGHIDAAVQVLQESLKA